MHSWKAATKNELLLMLYRRKTIVFLAFSALLPIGLALSFQALQPVLGLVAVSESFPIEMLGFYTLLWIPLFIFMASADLFPSEITSRTLKLALLRPITRFKAFAAKTAALGLGVAALLLILAAVTFVCSLFAGEPGSGSDWLGNIKAYAAAYVSMMALAAVFVFVAQFFKSASGFLIFSIVLYAAAKAIPFFAHSASAFSPASYTDWYLLWISSAVSPWKLLTTSIFLFASFSLFFTLGSFIFEKKEV